MQVPKVTCSRCLAKFEAPPMVVDGDTTCSACEPRDVSVFDFLYQFPRSNDLPDVVRIEDWFIQPHETNIVAIHDDAWPVIYEDEKPHVLDANEFPQTIAQMKGMLTGEPSFSTTETLAKLRKFFVTDSLLILPPVRMFMPDLLINAHHANWLVEYAFAGLSGRMKVDVAFVEPGVIRFTCDQRIAILARIESNHQPVKTFGAEVYEAFSAETTAALDALDA